MFASRCVPSALWERCALLSAWRDRQFVVREPMILGHGAAGVVVEVGSKVANLKSGDRFAWSRGFRMPTVAHQGLGCIISILLCAFGVPACAWNPAADCCSSRRVHLQASRQCFLC